VVHRTRNGSHCRISLSQRAQQAAQCLEVHRFGCVLIEARLHGLLTAFKSGPGSHRNQQDSQRDQRVSMIVRDQDAGPCSGYREAMRFYDCFHWGVCSLRRADPTRKSLPLPNPSQRASMVPLCWHMSGCANTKPIHSPLWLYSKDGSACTEGSQHRPQHGNAKDDAAVKFNPNSPRAPSHSSFRQSRSSRQTPESGRHIGQ